MTKSFPRVPERQDHRLDVLMATPIHTYMGLREAEADNSATGLLLEVTPALVNNSGMMHGGLVATTLDVACAHAIFPQLADHEVVMTNSLSISYLRPAPLGSTLWIRAEVIRRGRATAFLRAEAGIGPKLVASAQVAKSIITLEA